MRASLAVLFVLVANTPVGQATDLLHPEVCDPTLGCVSPAVCVVGVVCPASPCDPVAICSGTLSATPTTCAINATIHGTTCITEVSLDLQAQRSIILPVVGPAGVTQAGADVAIVQGDVKEFNLPNTWVTPIATTRFSIVGIPLGESTFGVYRSDIEVEGQPRFPEITGENHTYSQTTLEIYQRGGQGGDIAIAIALIQLDTVPDGCFVRSSIGAIGETSCPRFSRLLP